MKELFLDISISFISLLFAVFVFSVIGFVFGASISPLYSIMGIVLASVLLFFRLKTRNVSITKMFSIYVLLVIFVLLAGFLQYKFTDFSFDGCWYHQACVISLKWGWNPIYERIYDFSNAQTYKFNASLRFIEGYMKAYEILAANIYSLLGKIEVIKILKCIFALVAFSYVYYSVLGVEKLSKPVCAILSFLLVYNPVCIYQFFTNYNDDIVYYLFVIFLFSLVNYARKVDIKDSFFVMLMSSVLLACTKANGLYFVLILYLIWLLFYFSKPFAKNVFISFILILVCGINPLFTNIKYGNPPFYPIIQDSVKESFESYIVDVPVDFEDKSHVEKVFISLFSYPLLDSVLFKKPRHYDLKIPFSYEKGAKFIYPDMRLSGFGYYFAEVIILSLILLFFVRFQDKNDKKLFLCVMISVFSTVFLMPLAWWARYVPQTFILPLFINMAFLCENPKKYYAYIILALIFINSFIVNVQNWSAQIDSNKHRELIFKLEPHPMTETLPVKLLEMK